MKILKHISVGILLIALHLNVVAQQLPQFSQYYNNPLLFNPAHAGSSGNLNVHLQHRSQWVGFGGGPSTQIIGADAPILKRKFGVGGYMFNDQFGPLQNTGANLAYAYHMKVGGTLKMGMALSGSLFQSKVDGNNITLTDPNDQLIHNAVGAVSQELIGDAAFGLLLYNDEFYVGVSGLHLPRSKNQVFSGVLENAAMPLAIHSYFVAGVNYEAGEDLYIKPALLVNYTQNAPVQADLHFQVSYKNMVDGGVSYRYSDALALNVGVTFLEEFRVFYSYDVLVSGIKQHSSGSHEVYLGYSHSLSSGNNARFR